MRQHLLWRTAPAAALSGLCVAGALWAWTLRGDQVEMVNGDRYVGQVLSLGSENLVIQSEFLGTLKLPRAGIATIALGAPNVLLSTNAVHVAPPRARTNNVPKLPQVASTNTTAAFDSALKQLGANSNVIGQVQQQFLAGAGPEAEAKFNDLVSGLLSGKLGVNELRTEARTTLDRARSAQKELGDDAGSSLDSYLAILEGFLKETEPAHEPTNSAAGARLRAAPKASQSQSTAEE